jgi:hypothetical protein
MEKTKCIGIILLIIKIGILALTILSIIWLFPVMKNSGIDEPSEGFQIASNPNESNEKCKEYLDKFVNEEVGVYEAFDFKMKDIHKYSLGLVCLLIIQPSGFILLVIIIAIINNICFNGKGYEALKNILNIWKYLLSLLILLFFILLLHYFTASKSADFQVFSKCSFIDSNEFSKTYDNIFKIIENMKKFLITSIVYIFLLFVTSILEDFCLKCGKNEENEENE